MEISLSSSLIFYFRKEDLEFCQKWLIEVLWGGESHLVVCFLRHLPETRMSVRNFLSDLSNISAKPLTTGMNWRKLNPYLNCKSHVCGIGPERGKGSQAMTEQSGIHSTGRVEWMKWMLRHWSSPGTDKTLSFSGELAQSCGALWGNHVQLCLQSWSPSGQLATGCQSAETPGKKEKWVMLQAGQPAASQITHCAISPQLQRAGWYTS